MRNAKILLHHGAGAADLVSRQRAEIRRQEFVDGILNPVSFRFSPRRGIASKRLQRRAVAAGVGDDFFDRESVAHLRLPGCNLADSLK
jgi:hypothetical protein